MTSCTTFNHVSLLLQPDLAVSPKNTSNLNTDQLLSTLLDMSEITSDGFRVRAEIHFARGNFLSAMQSYLECLIVNTNYFQKPWSSNGQMPSQDWDERIFQKMIKCTSELSHHLQVLFIWANRRESSPSGTFRCFMIKHLFVKLGFVLLSRPSTKSFSCLQVLTSCPLSMLNYVDLT